MNFQDLVKVETPDFYLDVAFGKTKTKARLIRGSQLKGTRVDKSRYIETRKLEIIKDSLVNCLIKIVKSFPSIDQLPEFYLEMVKCTIDYAYLKKSLGAVNWAIKRVDEFFRIYSSKINKCAELPKINQYRREYYGRISSFIKQIKKELAFLEQARKVMKQFPTIKTSIPTVVIAGFPNIGKTTLLYKLTGSKPEISNYAFTTKGINVAYYKKDDTKIQLLDTPGTLDRFNKMNYIEQQAYLAIKLLAEKIIYIFDLSESYPIESQLKLYRSLLKLDKPIVCYLSKTDIIDKKVVDEFLKKHKCITDIKELEKEISSLKIKKENQESE